MLARLLIACTALCACSSGSTVAPPASDAAVAADAGADSGPQAPPITVVAILPSDAAGIPQPPADEVTAAWDFAFIADTTGGFSLQPLVSIQVSDGLVDTATFTSEHVYLRPQGSEERVGIEQRMYDPETETLWFVPDRYLREETAYEVVVDGLMSQGRLVEPTAEAFTTGRFTDELTAVAAQADGWATAPTIVAESTSGLLAWDAHRATLHPGTPPALVWGAWESGGGRLNEPSGYAEGGGAPVAVEIGADGFAGPLPEGGGPVRIFQRFEMFVPPGIGKVVLGRYQAPWLLNDERLLTPSAGAMREVWFTLLLPEGEPPEAGWPVLLYGHGYRSHRHHAPLLAAQLAKAGIATLAATAVGHGGGPDGTIELDGVQYPDGGRGVDADNDGIFLLEEGMRTDPLGPSHGGVRGLTDGVRQTVIDYMAATRAIEAGLPGISTAQADRAYFGISNGGRVGALLMAVDPKMRVGVLNVPPTNAFMPLADAWRDLWALVLSATVPPLTNAPHPHWGRFDEGIPFRGAQVQVGLPPGAAAIQGYLDRHRWAALPMNGAAYASRYATLGKRVLVQIGRGDPVVANPSSLDLVREGGLQQTTCLVWPERSLWFSQLGQSAQSLIHVFAFLQTPTPRWQPGQIAVAAREQIAQWVLSGGETLFDPDPDQGGLFGSGDVFEVPLSPASFDLLDKSFGYDPATL